MKNKFLYLAGIVLSISLFTACNNILASNETTLTEDNDPDSPVVQTIDEQAAAALVSSGITALNNGEYEEALGLFASARIYNPNNTDAALYWAFLNIASASVDPAVLTIAENAGFVNYPETIDDFISADWLSELPVGYDATDSNGDGLMEIATSLYPEIEIPAGYTDINLFDFTDWRTGDNLEGSGTLSSGEYFTAIIYHLQSNYPAGFNAPVTAMVELISGKLDETISVLQGISNFDSISLGAEMFIDGEFDPFTDLWPEENGELIPVVIGRSEVLLSISSLQIINSVLNSVLAVDMSISLSAFYAAMNPINGAFWGTDFLSTPEDFHWRDEIEAAYDWGALPAYPMAEGFLQTSADSTAIMGESKAYMNNALSNLAEALDGIALRSGDASIFTFSQAQQAAEFWDEVLEIVDVSSILVDKLSSSLNNNTPVAIPTEIFTDINSNLSKDYTLLSNWPSSEDWGNVTSVSDIPDAVEINLGALYAKPILALDNLIELNENSEPVIYKNDGSETIENYELADLINDIDAESTYAIKLKDVTFGGFLSAPADKVALYATEIEAMLDRSLFQIEDPVTGAISYYLSLVSPSAVYSSLHPAGVESLVNESSPYYVKATGSFWYSTVPEILDIEASPDTVPDGNDYFYEADEIAIGTTVSNAELSYSDWDYYSFVAVNGYTYTIALDCIDYPGMSFWDSSYDYIYYYMFNRVGNITTYTFDCTESGTYYLRVTGNYNNNGSTSIYSISITE